MRRIGIFVFYDALGCVDDYVGVLLASMQKILEELVVIANGRVEDEGYQKLKEYADKIFIRENQGYDGGAYKDVLTGFLSDEAWERWDEIVLFNDTFYGPLYPWESVFRVMEEKQVDFWGLSRHPKGGGRLSTGGEIPSHIQTYFLVCKKSLFLSNCWKEFWSSLKYPRSYDEAVESFEISFTGYFSEKGYQGSAFTDECPIGAEYGKNPYLYHFRELIQNFGFPVIKRRVVCLTCLDDAKETIDYIRDHLEYDINLIYSHVCRLCDENEIRPIAPFDPVKLEKFYGKHEKIYIYGHGAYGKGLARYFECKDWRYDGFIVSEKNEDNVGLFAFDAMEFDSECGIILALGEKAFYEVYPMVKEKLNDSQLCYPQYMTLTGIS